jgi:hypothetical protein
MDGGMRLASPRWPGTSGTSRFLETSSVGVETMNFASVGFSCENGPRHQLALTAVHSGTCGSFERNGRIRPPDSLVVSLPKAEAAMVTWSISGERRNSSASVSPWTPPPTTSA